MADKWPLANGNWSNAANWNDGTLPAVGDDVFADGKTVTINQNITVASIRTTQRSGGTTGGAFNNTGNFSIVADAIAGNVRCLSISGNGINTFTGNMYGGTGNICHAVEYSGIGTLNITGNAFGGSSNNSSGLSNGSSGTINVIGNADGGSGANTYGVQNLSTGIINITGNVTGGTLATAHGILNNSSGTIDITGNAIGGGAGNGAVNSSSGTLRVIRAISTLGAGAGLSGVNSAGITVVREIEFASNGRTPVLNFIFFEDSDVNLAQITLENTTTRTLTDPANNPFLLPSTFDVRQGITYNLGNDTGSLNVPDPSNVRNGVPTDNTVGTADLTAQDFFDAIATSSDPVAIRLRNVATVETTGDQISAFNV